MGIKVKEYIETINNANIDVAEKLLDEYVREGYRVDYLINSFKLFSPEKKELLINRFYQYRSNEFNKRITKAEDWVLVIKSLIKTKFPMTAYIYLKNIEYPKLFVDEESIIKILKSVKTKTIAEDYGEYFAEEVLKIKEDFFDLLVAKDKLTKETKEKIYKKSFNSIQPKKFEEYLSYEEKLDYTKLFVSERPDNYYFTYYLIWNKYYDKEDFDKLVLLIGAFAPADIIYDVLMKEKLSDSQIKMLEQSLYDTKDIEYIAYYTFYKNKKEFNRLFKSAIIFLGFVMLNGELFKNTDILNKVVNEIKEKEVKYTDSVVNKIDTSYQIKPKNGVKPNK